jgi:hypothetical protein
VVGISFPDWNYVSFLCADSRTHNIESIHQVWRELVSPLGRRAPMIQVVVLSPQSAQVQVLTCLTAKVGSISRAVLTLPDAPKHICSDCFTLDLRIIKQIT